MMMLVPATLAMYWSKNLTAAGEGTGKSAERDAVVRQPIEKARWDQEPSLCRREASTNIGIADPVMS